MLDIEEVIIAKLRDVNDHEKTLVVDGKYFLYKQKSVYVSLVADKHLRFFTRGKEASSGAAITIDVTAEVYDKLHTALRAPVLGTYQHDTTIPLELCNVVVDGSLNFLIIESPLYFIAKKAIQENKVRLRVQSEYISLTETQLSQLITSFKQVSYDNYYKFVYSKAQRRILNRCYKKKPFFNILHAFIPVAIEYSYVYNPLLDDPSNTFFANSKLMQTAINKNRCVTINSDLKCYMLTHEEICHALGLTRFMRFTPEFLYKFIVSLLRPDLPNFPSKTRKVYVHKADEESVDGFLSVYSQQAYEKKLLELADKAKDVTTEEDSQRLKLELAVLNSYVDTDALYYEIEKDRRALLNIGAVLADSKITTDVLYDILLEAQILGGEA